jgi:uncharacterized OB-fold protein
MVAIQERVFPVDPTDLLPAVTEDNREWWEALSQGKIIAQGCGRCSRRRFPIAPVCPYCGATVWAWQELSEDATVFSWIRYQKSFLPEFADVVPYVVVCAQLEEGVRMFGRMVGEKEPRIGDAIRGVVERWPGGRCVLCFV